MFVMQAARCSHWRERQAEGCRMRISKLIFGSKPVGCALCPT
jgi:LSD1 subclass zinc finger protein